MALDWAVGQLITATRLNRRLPVHVIKTVSQNVTSDATVNADAELTLSLVANTSYNIHGVLYVTSAANAAGDFQYAWEWTQTGTLYRSSLGVVDTLASGSSADVNAAGFLADTSSPSTAITYGASTTQTGVHVRDKFITGSSDLILTLTWSQASSNANATTLALGSWLTAFPVA